MGIFFWVYCKGPFWWKHLCLSISTRVGACELKGGDGPTRVGNGSGFWSQGLGFSTGQGLPPASLSLWLDPHRGGWLLSHKHPYFLLLRGTPLSPGGVLVSENCPHGNAKLSLHPNPTTSRILCAVQKARVPMASWVYRPLPSSSGSIRRHRFPTHCVLYPVDSPEPRGRG